MHIAADPDAHALFVFLLRQLKLSMSTGDGTTSKRHKVHEMLGQLREDGAEDGGESGGTKGWEEVSHSRYPMICVATSAWLP